MPVRSHWCDECNVDRLTNQALRRHVAAKHLAIRPFQCQNCPLAFSYQSTLQKHNTQSCPVLKQKSIGTSFECDRCNYETTVKNHMLHHQMYSCYKQREPSQLLYCDQCGYVTKRGTNAKEQLMKHVVSNPIAHRSTWICDQCHQIYPDKMQLSRHIERKHTPTELRKPHHGSKLRVCDRCDAVISHDHLVKHILQNQCTTATRNTLTGQTKVCDICEHSFKGSDSWNRLTRHILGKHFRPLWSDHCVCDRCDKELLFNRVYFVKHLRGGCTPSGRRPGWSRVTADIITTADVKMEVQDGNETTNDTG